VGTVSSSVLDVNPDVEEGARLRHWYDQGGGATAAVTTLSGGGGGGMRGDRHVSIAQMKEGEPHWLPRHLSRPH
jgi:replication factor A1